MQPGTTPIVRAEATRENSNDLLVQAVLVELQSLLGDKRFGVWIEGKIQFSISDDRLTASVSSPFLLNWMQKQFRAELAAAAQKVLGPSAQIIFNVGAPAPSRGLLEKTIDGGSKQVCKTDRTAGSGEVVPQTESPIPDATVVVPARAVVSGPTAASSIVAGRRLLDLADFVAGPASELALTAVRHVVGGQPVSFNPLFVCGPVGSGKTHLLEGACRQLKRNRPAANIVLITAEAFANYFTQALRDHTLPSFRQRFRGVDVLIVDNVDFFESKRAFQEEFLHTFSELADQGRQIILSAARHPRLLTKLSEELVSRFQSGLVCRLELPDLETRQKIVAYKSGKLSGEISPEAQTYIAQRFQGSVRELEGALNCLNAYYGMTKKRVTQPVAREVLADLERDCLKMIRLVDVERVICNLFGVRPKDLQSESRVRTISQPRMLAMYLARKYTPSAYTEIGQHFGGRNHSTVMSAERKVQQWLDQNESIRIAMQSRSIGEILQTLEQQLLAG